MNQESSNEMKESSLSTPDLKFQTNTSNNINGSMFLSTVLKTHTTRGSLVEDDEDEQEPDREVLRMKKQISDCRATKVRIYSFEFL